MSSSHGNASSGHGTPGGIILPSGHSVGAQSGGGGISSQLGGIPVVPGGHSSG
ncbi:MAG TPA: hypothetical protein VFY68_14985 [Nitrososphaeraceae archaeon]|nr:hypothetical protein [Nitrososphaeraceae archaeon]